MASRVKGESEPCVCERPRYNEHHQEGIQHFDVRDRRGKWHRCEHDELSRTTRPNDGTGILPERMWRDPLYPRRHIEGRVRRKALEGLYSWEWRVVMASRDQSGRFATDPEPEPTVPAIRRTRGEEQALAEARTEFLALEARRREGKKGKVVKADDNEELEPAA